MFNITSLDPRECVDMPDHELKETLYKIYKSFMIGDGMITTMEILGKDKRKMMAFTAIS